MNISLPMARSAWSHGLVLSAALALGLSPQIAASQCSPMIQPPATSLGVTNNLAHPSDRLKVHGDFVLSAGTFADLDPSTNGATVEVDDGAMPPTVVVSQALPAGAYDPNTKIGWTQNAGKTRWLFRNNNSGAPETNGIRRLMLIDRNDAQPNQVRLRVIGARGDYPVESAPVLPYKAIVTVDTACGETTFASTDCGSHASRAVNSVTCTIPDPLP